MTQTIEKTYSANDEAKIRNTKGIYIAVLNQGAIRPELSFVLTDMTHQNKYRLFLSYPAAKPISFNRNSIVKDFLAKPEYDYLMMIDSDIIPPINYLDLADYLIEEGKDIVSGVCFAYMDQSIVPLVLEYNTNPNEKPFLVKSLEGTEGLVEVDAVGTGAIIIKREVLEKVKAPFINRYDEDGLKLMGLDLSFCDKAKKLGFRTWCHLDYVCSHWTKVDLKDIFRAVTNREEIRRLSLRDQTYDKK